MLVRHRHAGRWYLIEAPEGSRVFRSSLTGFGTLLVPDEGREVPLFDWPSGLLVRLAESGVYGLRLLSATGPASEPADTPP